MGKLNGLFQFSSPLIVRGDALGKKYRTKIGEQDVILCFPELPSKPMEGFGLNLLLPPKDCCLGVHDDCWGHLSSYNTTEYRPNNCCADVLHVYIECGTDNPDNASEDIFESIDEWRTLLKKIICLEMRCVPENLMPNACLRSGIVLFCAAPTEKKYDPYTSFTLETFSIQDESALTPEKLVKLFECVRCGTKIKLEYELLIQAYEERSKGNYRYSLVQALSAVEVCIGNKIDIICAEKGIDAKRLIGNRSLGDKFGILRALGESWPTSNPNEEITKHRNDLFHMRLLDITVEELNEIILTIETYLNTYSPLYFE